MTVVKVGIVGCGSIAEHRHFPEYADNAHVEIIACFDPNRKRADMLARRYGVAVLESSTDVTRHPEIDAISACSPNDTHEVISTDALLHGKHVLCEKPMATTLEGAQRMVDAARSSGKLLMVAYNQRLTAAHQKAKEILAGGELGRVLTFQTAFGHRGPEHWSEARSKSTWFFDKGRSVFGAAGDLGIHKVDLLRYLLDDEVVEVSCFAGVLHKTLDDGCAIAVNDNVVALVRTQKGCVGTLAASWTYYGPEDNSTTLFCEKGIMKIYGDPQYEIRISKPGGQQSLYRLESIQTNEAQSKSGVIDAFVDCILNGRPSPISGEDGLKSLQVILAALESAEKSMTVRL